MRKAMRARFVLSPTERREAFTLQRLPAFSDDGEGVVAKIATVGSEMLAIARSQHAMAVLRYL